MRETSFHFEGGRALSQTLLETDEQGLPLHCADGLLEGDWMLATVSVAGASTTVAGKVVVAADGRFLLEFEPHDLRRLADLGEAASTAESAPPSRQTAPISITPPADVPVLVVEHDPDVSTCLLEVLRRHGFSTTLCATTDEALELLRERAFGLALVNWSGPGVEAGDFCRLARHRALRHDAHHGRMPIVGLTPECGAAARARALLAGADDALAMPFRWPELGARLLSVMQRP